MRKLVASLVLLAACNRAASTAVGSRTAPICIDEHPTLDQVFMKSAHNAYWVNAESSPADPFAAGTRMRIWDQLLHEHVRSLELDLHEDPSHPGEFRILHSDTPTNSTCYGLADCLQLFQRLDNVLPEHEVVHIAIELKPVDGLLSYSFFGGLWNPEDLDRLLWEHLGGKLYTPAEFLSRCAPGSSLRDCAHQVGWPTIDQLRGRYIVTVHGGPFLGLSGELLGANGQKDWWIYSGVADIRTRAAFPMHVVDDCILDVNEPQHRADVYNSSDPNFVTMWRQALDNTLFFQLEEPENPDFTPHPSPLFGCNGTPARPDPTPLPQRFHGIVRSRAAHLIDQSPYALPFGVSSNADDVGKAMQCDIVQQKQQIVMTDFPANFISDFQGDDPAAPPTQVSRPFFQAIDLPPMSTASDCQITPPECPAASWALIEPGSRFYFDTTPRIVGHDLLPLALPLLPWPPLPVGLPSCSQSSPPCVQNDPAKTGVASAVRVAPPMADEPVADWELFPATSMQGHPWGPYQLTPFGQSCFIAADAGSANRVQICRQVNDGDDRSIDILVDAFTNSAHSFTNTKPVDHHLIQDQRFGDALRVRITRIPVLGTTVELFTASEVNPDGFLGWYPHPEAGPFFFPGVDLDQDILLQHGDGVFTGTRLNQRVVSFSELSTDPHLVSDQSFACTGLCRSPSLPSHENLQATPGGVEFVGVKETAGSVYTQTRTLYTTDRFESVASGLGTPTAGDKFFLRRNFSNTSDYAQLFKCIDWAPDRHSYWLSTAMSCPSDFGPPGRSSGNMGFIATHELPGTAPLFHLRRATGTDRHEDVFAVGDTERGQREQSGFSNVRPPDWADALPHPIGFVFLQPFTPVPFIAPHKSSYQITESFTVDFADAPTDTTQIWVDVTPDSAPLDYGASWLFLDGAASGTVTIQGRMTPGTYRARMRRSDNDILAVSDPITVTAPASTLASDLTSYLPGQTISAVFTQLTGFAQDWIGLFPQGAPDTGYVYFRYTSGAVSGTLPLTGVAPGQYVLRAFANNLWVRLAESPPFTVLDLGSTVAPDHAAYPTGQTVVASFTNLTGAPRDFVAVAADGSPPTSVVQLHYTGGAVNGSLSFSGLPAGTYRLRAFANDLWVLLAESAAFTVGP